jgi:hypothetical protein
MSRPLQLRACVYQAEPWPIYDGTDETVLGLTLEEAFAEAAEQTVSDAGSDLLESPEEWCREMFRDHMVEDIRRALREPGDTYRAPDRVVYVLEEVPES